MDISLYVSTLQDRSFLALGGFVAAFLFDAARGALFAHTADPRPVLERVADALLYPLAFRLNRPGRSDGALAMRGFFVLALGAALFFALLGLGYSFVRTHNFGGVYLAALVALSVGTVGWFAPLRALAKNVKGQKGAPRPYLVLARATYTNLIPLDDAGLIRVCVTASIRSLVVRMAAPLLLFILFGWQVLILYWPVMTLALSTGQDGRSRAFSVGINALASLLLIVPTLLMVPVILAALFFSAGASFFRAVPGFFKVTHWPKLLQGGLPLLVVAYAMKLMLGGPRQDRAGAGIQAPWVGPTKGTAKLEPRDIGRILYFQGVVLLLMVSTVLLIAAAI